MRRDATVGAEPDSAADARAARASTRPKRQYWKIRLQMLHLYGGLHSFPAGRCAMIRRPEFDAPSRRKVSVARLRAGYKFGQENMLKDLVGCAGLLSWRCHWRVDPVTPGGPVPPGPGRPPVPALRVRRPRLSGSLRPATRADGPTAALRS